MPVLPPEREKHNYSTAAQLEDSFPAHPSLLATAMDLNKIAEPGSPNDAAQWMQVSDT
ncbi:hypothetical protein FBY31_3997 [Arthrobacter sp. SLBN-100]|uniref:hypothetical protein n=1 Tax=Arthrobacter sp. SLBN-100 TaxID=2768450 RepID=UPI00116F1D4C|nr:hypothetical protein [Arthrobacter sp. SLBN-100]TQJ69824.1 hypothetical protein FBY31_3997 [Arthrobacter sp. SLBN-100]